jgi:hypothetical protein
MTRRTAHADTTGDVATAAAAACLIERRAPFGCHATGADRWRFTYPAGEGHSAAIATTCREMTALERLRQDVNTPPTTEPAAYSPIPAWIPPLAPGSRGRRRRNTRPHDDG